MTTSRSRLLIGRSRPGDASPRGLAQTKLAITNGAAEEPSSARQTLNQITGGPGAGECGEGPRSDQQPRGHSVDPRG